MTHSPPAHPRVRWQPWTLAAVVLLGFLPAAASAQTPEQQAVMLLDSARRAYNEKNYAFATPKFKEFIDKYPTHKEAPSARYAYALCLIEGPDRKYPDAVAQLQQVADDKNFAEQPYALYYLGLANREMGKQELAQAVAKPQEAQQRKQAAAQRFDEAAKRFGLAIPAFTGKVKAPPPEAKELPVEYEWGARSRCDQAEMQIRLAKAKDAQTTAAPFLSDELLAKSRYRRLGLYYHGFASFLQKEYNAAGKSLNQLTPFADPIFGTHARYLLARVHHVGDEKSEAALHYEGVVAQHVKDVAQAKQLLTNPANYQNNPDEKARLQALATGPMPDHVARASLYGGVIHYENAKFAEALARFSEFLKASPNDPLTPEVQLRIGFCLVQTKQFKPAIDTLRPLVDKQPQFADQALLWIAKATAGSADPANPKAYADTLKASVDIFKQAAEKAKGDDAEVKARRGIILLEMSDAQQLAGLYKDAAATLGQLVAENLLPARADEVLQRLASAHHLAGSYDESDKVCQQFREKYPRSPLLATVAFRGAENAYFRAFNAEKNKAQPDEVKKLQDETIKRYQAVIEQFPDLPQINLARYGLAMGLYRKNDLEKCLAILDMIPAPDRVGELAAVPYVMADCYIKTAPQDTSDAIAAGRFIEAMTKAAEGLSTFAGSNPKDPMAPDALLKLGFCQQNLAEILAEPPKRQATLQAARATYDNFLKAYPQSDLFPQATLERAKVMATAGDPNGSMNELLKFTRDPLKNSSVAPLAMLRLAALHRSQNRAQQAADVMAAARKDYEPALAKDPARASWIPLLKYHHGVALQELGKRVEAKAVFDEVVQQNATSPEAVEAALRSGQCQRDEAKIKLDAAMKILAQSGLKEEQLAPARKQRDEGLQAIRDSIKYLEDRAAQFKDKESPARARMYYDAAWASRMLADVEVEEARKKLVAERWQKMKDDVAKKTPMGKTPFPVPMPVVAPSEVALQPSEDKTRKLYQAMIEAFPDLASSADARFELAELYSERNEHDAAVKLLQAALDQEPPADLTERIQLRLGVCLAAKGDADAAMKKFEPIAKNDKSPLQGQALYRAGECLMQKKSYDEAAKRLAKFRDDGRYQNLPNTTDRALLRLGHAYRELKQWDASRQAHEQVANRFPGSPWVHEARYGMAWAHQMKGEYDQAVTLYNQVTAGTVTELGARAQLNVGMCRLAQKKYAEASTAFLVVPFTYDYPDLSAAALLEAARALAEDKQKDKAIPLLERLLRDHPESEYAEAAKKRLELLKKEG